jgi:hypothetical protein
MSPEERASVGLPVSHGELERLNSFPGLRDAQEFNALSFFDRLLEEELPFSAPDEALFRRFELIGETLAVVLPDKSLSSIGLSLPLTKHLCSQSNLSS